jgi:vancomycin permeability regulator SanA
MNVFVSRALNTVIFVIVVDAIAAALWGWGTVRYFQETPVAKAPVAVVLMGDFNETTGDLGDETRRRLNHALDLYNEEAVEYVLCVGGARPRRQIFGSESMRQFLIDAGIPPEKVYLEKRSYDSKTAWKEIRRMIGNYGWSRIVIVSSPFHLYRFRRIISDGPAHGLKIIFSPYSLKETRPQATHFDMWREIHYQWIAHYAQLLPEKAYDALIVRLRAQ